MSEPTWFADPDFDDRDYDEDDYCMEIECPFCDGTGETNSAVDINGRITFDCPECGGTGWC